MSLSPTSCESECHPGGHGQQLKYDFPFPTQNLKKRVLAGVLNLRTLVDLEGCC